MKTSSLAAFLFVPIFALFLGFVPSAHSQWPAGCEEDSLPSHDPKYPEDQLIIICVPSPWNGQLVMYAHGYVPPQAPLALPIDELTVNGTFVPQLLLSQGFAFATTSFHKNGVAIEQGAQDLNKLLRHFKSKVPAHSLNKTYVIGGSEGGLVALLLLERFRGKYDAGLALCAPIGGSVDFINRAYDFRVVFDYFFPGIFTFPPDQPGAEPFGAVDVPENAFVFWDSVYVPRIIEALAADPLATAQLFAVTKTVIDLGDPSSIVESALTLLFYSIFGTNDQIATAGGIPYDNRSRRYSGSTDDAALNAGVERIAADGRARAYARRFYEPSGNLHKPLVTLHNTLDPVVPFEHEVEYSRLVAKKKKLDFLTVIPVPRFGHCNFTAEEIVQAFTVMVQQAGGQLVN